MNTDELVVSEWINSTRDDLGVISLISQVPLPAAVCYHCGQAVEKILKAYLIAKENELLKTHDLILLIKKCEKHSPDFGKFKNTCADISTFATIRYPPETNMTEQKMGQTIKDTHEIVDFTMEKLKQLGYNPPPQPTSAAIEKIMAAINAQIK